jgi:hypothetical protein
LREEEPQRPGVPLSIPEIQIAFLQVQPDGLPAEGRDVTNFSSYAHVRAFARHPPTL